MVLLACLLLWGGGAAMSAPGAGAEQNRAAKDAGPPQAASKGPARDAGAVGSEVRQQVACPAGMMYLPTATFTMGSNDKKNKKYWLQAEDEPEWPWLDEPIHKVAIKAVCMDTTEVTVAAYRACMQSGKCEEPKKSNCSWHKPNSDDHPQDCVNWAQADQFCRAMGKRLPTEEEWEYGARGTDGRRYPWGNSDPHSDTNTGKYQEFSRVRPGDTPCPVGQFRKFASPFGLLDMVGNLAEWTSSDNCEPKGSCRKIVRGDSGPTLGEMRCAHRVRAPADSWASTVGFRCVLSL